MASRALSRWTGSRARLLDEVEAAHGSIVGTGRAARFVTEQVNHAYAVLLCAQFQGFCRDIHDESADALCVGLPERTHAILRRQFGHARMLDRGNPTPANLHTDFLRFDVPLWDRLTAVEPRTAGLRARLEDLNRWRNAIVHSDFDPTRLGGTILRVATVRRWRRGCSRLARRMDAILFHYLSGRVGHPPWGAEAT